MTPSDEQAWRDTRLSPGQRAAALIPLMTLEEKVAQLAGIWVGADASGGGVAPHQADMVDGQLFGEVIRHGLGQLTRPFGTAPVEPVAGARSLAAAQAQIVASNRFGIPALVHEECLTGFSAWLATVYPTPLSWGAAFDPDLVAEMALRLGRPRSVMNSYTEIDGVPTASDESLLTGLLREQWGFTGTVVADYFAIKFLHTLHGVAAGPAEAAEMALRAGIDVELPTIETFGETLVAAVRSGAVDEALIDRALTRVLTQKAELGLLDASWQPEPDGIDDLTFDDETNQAVALRLAREAVVVVRNTGILPLGAGQKVALIGPIADDPMALLGCYTFPSHVGHHHPEYAFGVDVPTLREALGALRPDLAYAPGCAITSTGTSGFAEAVALAADSDVVVLAVGDRPGMFGRGTTGEGSDASDLRLPGVQQELIEAVLATGTPVVVVVLAGKPYALGAAADASAAVVYAFLAGQRGAQAVAEVLTGAVNPSGRLPVGVPRHSGGLPSTYLAPKLGHKSRVSSVDPTPAFPFGHGLSYTTFEWSDAGVAGPEVVQLYLHDPVAQTTQPVVRLIGYQRVPLAPGEAARVSFTVPADLTAFTGLAGTRIVEPGDVELRFGRNSADFAATAPLRLTGATQEVGPDRRLLPKVRLEAISLSATGATGRSL